MHLMAKYLNWPLRELQREKSTGETGEMFIPALKM